MPSPTPDPAPATTDFFDALKAVNSGARITKLEWGNENFYGLLRSGHLTLHKTDGRFYDWIISDGDLQGIDWVILPEALVN